MMKSARLVSFASPLQLCEVPVPQPSGSEVLLRVVSAGICHTDLHLIDGGYDAGRGEMLRAADRGVKLPLTLGHEIVGRPVAGLRTQQEPWDQDPWDQDYLVYPWIGCGGCRSCEAGNENLCAQPRTLGIYRDGGFAEYVLVPHEKYLLPLNGIDPLRAAPYGCAGLTTYSALKKAGELIRQEPIVLIGAGGLGLMALHLLKAMGGMGAIVVDIHPAKREAALRAGALDTVDAQAADALQQVIAKVGSAPRAVIDFVGSETTAQLAFQALAKGGKLIAVGLFGGAAPWALPLIPLRGITIQGNFVGTLAELSELLALVGSSAISMPIVHTTLEQAGPTLEDLRRGQIEGRAIILLPRTGTASV
jgi:alcohol dehydrogenase/propanol-preferring alcohol dehydrogenase